MRVAQARAAALVLAQFLAVEPRGGAPVRCTEHEKHPSPAPGLRNGDIAGIRSDVSAIGNAGERRAPGERHHDLAFAAVLLPEPELPAAVQIEPFGALEVGARMFGEGTLDEREDYAEVGSARSHGLRFS